MSLPLLPRSVPYSKPGYTQPLAIPGKNLRCLGPHTSSGVPFSNCTSLAPKYPPPHNPRYLPTKRKKITKSLV